MKGRTVLYCAVLYALSCLALTCLALPCLVLYQLSSMCGVLCLLYVLWVSYFKIIWVGMLSCAAGSDWKFRLLLVGQATSNVFDGAMPLGGGSTAGDVSSGSGNGSAGESHIDSLMLKGTPHRAAVGYLTQLEALRYCQVR